MGERPSSAKDYKADSAREALRLLAWSTGRVVRRQLRVIRVLYGDAHAGPLIADMTEHGNARYRQNLDHFARRLGELRGLRKGVDQAQASDVLWFYFS